MRFTVQKSKLHTALQSVARATVQRPVQPILSQVLIEAYTTASPWYSLPVPHLVLLGTDLDLSIRTIIEADVQEEGKATISPKFLSEILSKLPSTESVIQLVFDATAQVAKLAYCDGAFTIRTFPAEEFPRVASLPEMSFLTFPGQAFLRALQQTVYASSPQEAHSVLSGVSLKLTNGRLEFASTDGSRLAQTLVPLESSSMSQEVWLGLEAQPLNAIIPAKTLQEFYKLTQGQLDAHATVQCAFHEGQIYLMGGVSQVISRLLDGQYPRYEQLIPTQFGYRVTFQRQELINKLELTALSASDRHHIVKFSVDPLGLMSLSANRDDSECFNKLVASLEGDAIEFAFNYRYLLDALRVMDADVVTLETNGPLAPAVLRPSVDGALHLALVMPVQVRT
ncbi:MAG: DNA polymerase III subunit beta [Vampirovibrionales bacterium]